MCVFCVPLLRCEYVYLCICNVCISTCAKTSPVSSWAAFPSRGCVNASCQLDKRLAMRCVSSLSSLSVVPLTRCGPVSALPSVGLDRGRPTCNCPYI